MKSQSVSIQVKATEQYFPMVLFIMLYKLTIMKAVKQYFPVKLFITL